MMLDRLFRPKPAQSAGRALYGALVAQSRAPALYADMGAPDTAEGRFEIYTLHLLLLLERLRGQGAEAAEVSQALFDTYLKGLDDGLRELGVGDLSVGKKMRKLGEAFYGRGKSYDAAVAALPDHGPLTALLQRTVYAAEGAGDAARLTDYVVRQRDYLAQLPIVELLHGHVTWRCAS